MVFFSVFTGCTVSVDGGSVVTEVGKRHRFWGSLPPLAAGTVPGTRWGGEAHTGTSMEWWVMTSVDFSYLGHPTFMSAS